MKKCIFSLVLALCCMCGLAMAEESGVLTLPEDVTRIDAEAFYQTESFGKAILPEGVEEIGGKAFAQSGLKEINLPSSLRSIADDAFEGCKNLRVSVEKGCYAYDWAVKNGHYTPWLRLDWDGKDVALGGVIACTAVPQNTDADCLFNFQLYLDGRRILSATNTGGELVYMPSAAGQYSLVVQAELDSGKKLVWEGMLCSVKAAEAAPADDFEYTIEDGAVCIDNYIGAETTLIVPANIEGHPVTRMRLKVNTTVKAIVLPDSIVEIGTQDFSACEVLERINIPEKVETIGASAFADCKKLTTVTGGNGVTKISMGAFVNCAALEKLSLGDQLSYIGDQAFDQCVNLEEITIGEGISYIGEKAFNNCAKLKRVVFKGDAAEGAAIKARAFSATALTEIELPEGFAELRDYAFQDCEQLERVALPESIGYIGHYIVDYSREEGRPAFAVKENSFAHEWCVKQEYAFDLT